MFELHLPIMRDGVPSYEGMDVCLGPDRRLERAAITTAARLRRQPGFMRMSANVRSEAWNAIWDLFPAMGRVMHHSNRYCEIVMRRVMNEAQTINEEWEAERALLREAKNIYLD